MSTYQAMAAQSMSDLDVISVLEPLLYHAGTEAEALGRAELARMMSRITGEPITAHLHAGGQTPLLKRARIADALRTTIADPDAASLVKRLERLTYSDPLAIAQSALTDSMKRHKQITGYVRVLNNEACELCQWLAKDGYVYPSEQPMHQHPGCLCTARPVTKTIRG
jgi:hypothetical protein